MPGAVVENLSNRKLAGLMALLAAFLAVCLLLGGVVSPQPSSSMVFSMQLCDTQGRRTDWVIPDRFAAKSPTCRRWLHQYPDHAEFYKNTSGNNLIFTTHLPHAMDGAQLAYSPWFQNLLGVVAIDFAYIKERRLPQSLTVTMAVKLGVRDRVSAPWREYSSIVIERQMYCVADDPEVAHAYTCEPVELFELGSNDYPYYLLNIHFPVCDASTGRNCDLNPIDKVDIVAIHQNGGFTLVWLALKTLLTPLMLGAVVWYYRRVRALPRSMVLLEKIILALGVTMLALDVPIEWLSLLIRMPFMLLLSDIRQGLFYAVLFSFWLIFAGEHLIDDAAPKNELGAYKRNLAFVLVSIGSLLLFDLADRGMHLSNPFHSIWATRGGAKLAYAAIVLAAISIGVYFCFLCYKIARVLVLIKRKRQNLAAMAVNRRLKFEGIIYRFRFLMILTILCAGLTAAGLIMENIGEGQLRWGDYEDSPLVSTTSAFLTGTFALWNVYVFLLLAMYAPSHKDISHSERLAGEQAEMIELDDDYLYARDDFPDDAVESSSLTALTKPAQD